MNMNSIINMGLGLRIIALIEHENRDYRGLELKINSLTEHEASNFIGLAGFSFQILSRGGNGLMGCTEVLCWGDLRAFPTIFEKT